MGDWTRAAFSRFTMPYNTILAMMSIAVDTQVRCSPDDSGSHGQRHYRHRRSSGYMPLRLSLFNGLNKILSSSRAWAWWVWWVWVWVWWAWVCKLPLSSSVSHYGVISFIHSFVCLFVRLFIPIHSCLLCRCHWVARIPPLDSDCNQPCASSAREALLNWLLIFSRIQNPDYSFLSFFLFQDSPY